MTANVIIVGQWPLWAAIPYLILAACAIGFAVWALWTTRPWR